MKINVLFVEDNKIDQMAFKKLVKNKNLAYVYNIASSLAEANKILDTPERFDVIIVDYLLGDGDASDILNRIGNTPFIVVTGAGDEATAVQMMKAGAYDYLIKDQERNYLEALPVRVENAINYKRSQEQLRIMSQAIKNIIDSVYITDLEDRLIFVNGSFCESYGYEEEEILGQESRIFEENISSELDQEGYKGECNHKTKDGREFPVSLSKSIIRNEDGDPIAIVGVTRDITERVRWEEELKRSNQELEQFAYVASHDLQEPLRMVSSYTQLLAKHYQDKLDSTANEFISFAVDGATRMQRLINDLLAYSRLGTHGAPFESIDLETVFDETVSNLQIAIDESGSVVTHDLLPTVIADKVQIGRLFQNLIGNAIKFRNESPPQVHISAKQNGEQWVFSVCDNGIGLAPEFAKRIFVIFQRLHTREEYSGTGVGLAICKKIVERHGGRIWVESQPEKGATFYFTLPIRKEEKL